MAIRNFERSETYLRLANDALRLNEKKDCGVIAVAAVAGISYEEARNTLKQMGRREGRGTTFIQIVLAIACHGYTPIVINPTDMLKLYPKNIQNNRKNLTTSDVAKWPDVWNGRYVAFCNRHCVAITGGENHDWSRNRSLRIKRLVKFVKK